MSAWPVDDSAAVAFARRLYATLPGVGRPEAGVGGYAAGEPQSMHVAMRQARIEIASEPGGVRIRGAYQHYGDPHFRFVDAASARRRRRRHKHHSSLKCEPVVLLSGAFDAPPP